MTLKTAFPASGHAGRLCSTSSAGVWILQCVCTTTHTHTQLLSARDPKPNLSSLERLAVEPSRAWRMVNHSSRTVRLPVNKDVFFIFYLRLQENKENKELCPLLVLFMFFLKLLENKEKTPLFSIHSFHPAGHLESKNKK